MDITLKSEDRGDYLFIQSIGSLESLKDLEDHGKIIYEEIMNYNHDRILLSDLETTFPERLFIYHEVAGSYEENLPIEVKNLKLAIVVLPKYNEIAEFWQTACSNRGFKFDWFNDTNKALAWLME